MWLWARLPRKYSVVQSSGRFRQCGAENTLSHMTGSTVRRISSSNFYFRNKFLFSHARHLLIASLAKTRHSCHNLYPDYASAFVILQYYLIFLISCKFPANFSLFTSANQSVCPGKNLKYMIGLAKTYLFHMTIVDSTFHCYNPTKQDVKS